MDNEEQLQRMLELALVEFIQWAVALRNGELTGRKRRIVEQATEAGRWIFNGDLNDHLGFDNVVGVLFEDIDPDYIRRKLKDYCLAIINGEEVEPLPKGFLGR